MAEVKASVVPEFLSTFGSRGTGNGQFSGTVRDVDVHPLDGNIFVVSSKVQVFSPDGKFLGVFAADKLMIRAPLHSTVAGM